MQVSAPRLLETVLRLHLPTCPLYSPFSPPGLFEKAVDTRGEGVPAAMPFLAFVFRQAVLRRQQKWVNVLHFPAATRFNVLDIRNLAILPVIRRLQKKQRLKDSVVVLHDLGLLRVLEDEKLPCLPRDRYLGDL